MFTNKDAVGSKLRDYRERSGVSGRALANLIGCTQSFLSKIEAGKLRPTPEIIKYYSTHLKLSAKEELGLLALTEAFLRSFDSWSTGKWSGEKAQSYVSKRIQDASFIEQYSAHLISGFLQTKEYAEAVFRIDAPHLSAQEVKKAVTARLKWQEFKKDKKKQIKIVLSEAALANWILSPELMDSQLVHLLEEMQQGQTEVRIVPQATKVNVIALGPFTIYDNMIVSVESHHMQMTLWEDADVAQYKRRFDLLLKHSVTGGQASSLIKKYRALCNRDAGR